MFGIETSFGPPQKPDTSSHGLERRHGMAGSDRIKTRQQKRVIYRHICEAHIDSYSDRKRPLAKYAQ